MSLKNLFTYLHEEGDNEIDVAVYENPYETNHIPDDLADQMRITPPQEQSADTTEQDKQNKALRKKYCLGAGISALLAVAFVIPYRFVSSSSWSMAFLLLILIFLVVSWVFLYKIKKLSLSASTLGVDLENFDAEAYARRMNQAYKEALAYMGVPENTVTVEILPYPYVMKKGKAVFAGNKNTYDNTPMEFFVKDDRLCMTDGEALFEIPLSHIVGYRTYDADYRIEFWLKEEAHDSQAYAAFHIKKAGLLEYKTHTYHGVEIQDDSTGQGYELLIPGYDFEKLKTLVDLTQLDN